MAKRRFELPGIQDLSKEQEAARALPKEGQHLIIGGPGTGKSVVSLLRARRHQRDGDDYRFLVFNHLLDRASGQLFGDGLVSRTWIGWFLATFEEFTGQPAPRLSPDRTGGFRKIDWDGVEAIIQELPQGESGPYPFLVVDEGQDMPPAFYGALANLGFEWFFVVADQNQQITKANSNREEIENCLAIEPENVIELRQNHRNRYSVARLAREFHTRNPASPPPDLPAPAPGAVPLLYYYDEGQIEAVARGILRLADRDPRHLIGVLAPNNRVRERYLEALRSTEVRLDNPRPAISTYHMGERAEVSFDEGGLLVINAQACKGLEFDAVVLADIDEHIVRKDPDAARRLFYVMVARAREQVFLFMKRGCGGEIEKLLPTDPQVLRRKENL